MSAEHTSSSAQLIDGKAIAQQIRLSVKENVQARVAQGKRAPGLAVILVGNDPASEVYVGSKRRACEEVGFVSKSYDLPETTTEQELLALIDQLNHDNSVDGILVQLPLPEGLDANLVIEHINPKKMSMDFTHLMLVNSHFVSQALDLVHQKGLCR